MPQPRLARHSRRPIGMAIGILLVVVFLFLLLVATPPHHSSSLLSFLLVLLATFLFLLATFLFLLALSSSSSPSSSSSSPPSSSSPSSSGALGVVTISGTPNPDVAPCGSVYATRRWYSVAVRGSRSRTRSPSHPTRRPNHRRRRPRPVPPRSRPRICSSPGGRPLNRDGIVRQCQHLWRGPARWRRRVGRQR